MATNDLEAVGQSAPPLKVAVRLERLCSIDEAALQWGVSRVTVWRWIKRGLLRADKVKATLRVLPGQLPPNSSDHVG